MLTDFVEDTSLAAYDNTKFMFGWKGIDHSIRFYEIGVFYSFHF